VSDASPGLTRISLRHVPSGLLVAGITVPPLLPPLLLLLPLLPPLLLLLVRGCTCAVPSSLISALEGGSEGVREGGREGVME
jgi:hypothetical protein